MDLRKLKKLIELVEESSIAELEITEGEEKVRISKSGAATAMPNYAFMPPMMQPSMPPTAQVWSARFIDLLHPDQVHLWKLVKPSKLAIRFVLSKR